MGLQIVSLDMILNKHVQNKYNVIYPQSQSTNDIVSV